MKYGIHFTIVAVLLASAALIDSTESLEMLDDERRVASLIRAAFCNVRLGNGIGLRQAQGLDDYADSNTLAKYRTQDEKDDWSSIPVSELKICESSLSFFDAEGMRFHLPAYLIAALEGTHQSSLVFHLTYPGLDARSKFALLSDSQRNGVREFLLLRLSGPYGDFERPMIESSLAEFWTAMTDQ